MVGLPCRVSDGARETPCAIKLPDAFTTTSLIRKGVTEQCWLFCRELLFDGFDGSCESLAIHAFRL